MEDGVNLPSRGDAETESHVGNYFLHFEGTSSFHLEFPGSIHVEIGALKPDLVPYFPWGKLRGYPFLHLLLGNLVGSLGIFLSGR